MTLMITKMFRILKKKRKICGFLRLSLVIYVRIGIQNNNILSFL
ncbi:hypothetical protein LPICM17_60049 [Lactococcus piscium]|nr:hypothetical protein LP2241_10252 [Lactococcus piscium]SOB48582.1 hypothetical protein LPICM17_60049 [Lactococcus piscium]